MISLEESWQRIVSRTGSLPPVRVPLLSALGLCLNEECRARAEVPPFSKSLVDGVAVSSRSLLDERGRLLSESQRVFRIVEDIYAGHVPEHAIGVGQASRIMTGAPLPDGADAVVMVEETEDLGAEVRLRLQRFRLGQNVLKRGAVTSVGDLLVAKGKRIGDAELGLLAEEGVEWLEVIRRPRVWILTTGDELVSHTEQPGPGQIRNSNTLMLQAAVLSAGCELAGVAHVGDETGELHAAVERGLAADVLLLSGGVSAGKKDLVPGVLESLGVEPVFHKVAVKPGKPVWFGVRESSAGATAVFGLPGNPVSSLVTFHAMVGLALRRLSGELLSRPVHHPVCLSEAMENRGERATYWPVVIEAGAASVTARGLSWLGSSDQRHVAAADGWVLLPQGKRELGSGELVQFLPRRLPFGSLAD